MYALRMSQPPPDQWDKSKLGHLVNKVWIGYCHPPDIKLRGIGLSQRSTIKSDESSTFQIVRTDTRYNCLS